MLDDWNVAGNRHCYAVGIVPNMSRPQVPWGLPSLGLHNVTKLGLIQVGRSKGWQPLERHRTN